MSRIPDNKGPHHVPADAGTRPGAGKNSVTDTAELKLSDLLHGRRERGDEHDPERRRQQDEADGLTNSAAPVFAGPLSGNRQQPPATQPPAPRSNSNYNRGPAQTSVHHPQPQTSASGDPKETIRNTDKSQSATADQSTSAMPQAGDHILNTLTGPGSAPTGVDKQTNNQPAAIDNERAFAIADRLAERILVSDRSLSSDSAVHIQLRDSVLGGAEIAISRDQGQIIVAFHLRDDHADHQLSAQLGNLQQHLEDRLKQPVRIEVSVAGDGAGDGAGDQGRSRNRRDLWDEWQNRES